MQKMGILLGSIIIVIAFNLFLLPHQILSSGLSGVSMIIGMVTPFNTGIANFLLNLPLLIIGYLKLGKKFMLNTIICVLLISVGLSSFPPHPIANDIILSSIFGGALVGIGVGIIFRCSSSTGGFDIVGMIVSRSIQFPIGTFLTVMNGIVIVISGFLFDWDSALYTLVSIYVTGKVVDAIYTDHAKLTITIITEKGEEMRAHLLQNLYRGLTVMDGVGAYSNNKRNVLMTVISKYELNDVKKLIKEVDTSAFVNITETIEVMGLFHKANIQ